MNTETFKKVLISTLFFSLFSINAAHASSDSDQIKSLITHYEIALNGGDIEGVLKLYGKKPTFMPQNAPAQIGRSVVKKAYQGVFSSLELNVTFKIHELEVLGDTAWLRTSSAGKTTILARKMVIDEGNNELFILKKESGIWKIHQYLFASNKPRK